MKLRNKKTGEIVMVCKIIPEPYEARDFECSSLAELNEEWEDYEEPKEYWFIDAFGNIIQNKLTKHRGDAYTDMSSDYEIQKSIGNYFSSREEAQQAVEKLKAWKRLKDKGFKLDAVVGDTFFCLDIFMCGKSYEAIKDDLNIVFGGNDESNK